jgi:hypothetical protein
MGASPQFAVLQKEIAGPTPDQMKRAFRAFTHLTDADAVRLAVSARGILMRHLRQDQARAVQRALQAEGAAVTMVAERNLPELPEGLALHRLELWPQALAVYDPLGRRVTVNWEEITVIAAGSVLRVDLTKTQTEIMRLRRHVRGAAGPTVRAGTGRGAGAGRQFLLEMVLGRAAIRYQINAAEFEFQQVLAPTGLATEEQFIWLTRELCRHAPQALLNSGARRLRDGAETVPIYSYQRVLLDEMIWLLWHQTQTKRSGPAPATSAGSRG